MLEPTGIAVSILTYAETWIVVTMFLIESGESVSLKVLKYFVKSCSFLQLSLCLAILEFTLPIKKQLGIKNSWIVFDNLST